MAKATFHICYKVVIDEHKEIKLLRPCGSSPNKGICVLDPSQVDCEGCIYTNAFRELLLEYELSEMSPKEFCKMHYARLKEKAILEHAKSATSVSSIPGFG